MSLLLSALLTTALALADPASDLLQAVDNASNQGDDAHLVVQVESSDRRGHPVSRTLEIWQKGTDKRLVRYTAPERLAGIGLLVPDGQALYLFLPSYGRARRVVGEARGSAFQGTDFALEDLARMRWSQEYEAELVAPLHLRLTPRDEKASSAQVELHVRGSDHLPSRVEHYDDEGALVRRITFDDVRDVSERPMAHQITVEDLAHGRTSRATVVEAAFDSALTDDLFTLVHLTQR